MTHLKAITDPERVALIGASDTPGRLTARPQSFLTKHGYSGEILPVNPRRETVQGLPALPSVAESSKPIDHAYILLDANPALAALEDCAKAGIPVVSMLADGFAEAGDAGRARQYRAAAIARESGIHLIGPNSTGIVHIPNRFICTSNAAFATPDLRAGGLTVLSQSGSMIGMILSRGLARGMGFAGFASLGNEAVTDVGRFGQWMLDDPRTDSFALFLETVRDPEALENFAKKARDCCKPVVAYVIGQSDEGESLAVSHTGALTGASGAISAFLRDIGIAEVKVFDALLDTPRALVRGRPDQARPRTATVLTTTGGGGGMVLDQINAHGVGIAGCGAKTRNALEPKGISLGSGKLVDVTMAGAKPDVMKSVIAALLDDPETGVLVVAIGSSAQFNPDLTVDPLVAALEEAKEDHAPLVVLPLPHAPDTLKLLTDKGIPTFTTPESCAEGVAALLEDRSPRERSGVALPAAVTALLDAAQPGLLDEYHAGQVFAAFGVPQPAQVFIPDGGRLPGNFSLNFPVVAKLTSPDLPHKTEVGAISLNLRGHTELTHALRDMRAKVTQTAPKANITGALVQEMATGLGEALIGLTRDPRVGPLITLAAGGTLAEILKDSTLRCAPVDLATAQAMINEIKNFALLRGYRGHATGDLEALAHCIVAISQLAQHPRVIEAEINPMLIGAEGAMRLDALIRLS